ncbi:ABC transporter permease [Microbacterium sp. ZXX196]|uniref:ABC transporter permease n=1 Tax=Microbacterium sp. ZXX196 TaxID=2609291 RepID=UPI0012B8551C|nr:ABC transporter permease [Microbacterium sp. ZXX196]MTE24657.1 ABC transporter permease subunit [Microbacterium sp. ZXX196]
MNAARPVSLSRATALVAQREIVTRVRSKAFLVSTGILLVGIVVAFVVMQLLGDREQTTSVAAPAAIAAELPDGAGIEVTTTASAEEARALVAEEEVDAAVVADDASPAGVTIVAQTEAPEALVSALSLAPTVELLDPDGAWSALRYIMGIAFGVIFMGAAMSFGMPVATSVVEEKQTRVVEILITAIPARALLAGKVLGNTAMAFAQIALVAITVSGSLLATGQTEILAGLGSPLLWFALFFVTGFLLIATLFAATGAMVSRQEDISQTISPILYLVMAPYMLVIFFSNNPLVMAIMSYVPFSSPVSMPIRMFFGEAEWWEPIVSIVLSLAACVGVVALAARIYENSLLRMGARVSWRDALAH